MIVFRPIGHSTVLIQQFPICFFALPAKSFPTSPFTLPCVLSLNIKGNHSSLAFKPGFIYYFPLHKLYFVTLGTLDFVACLINNIKRCPKITPSWESLHFSLPFSFTPGWFQLREMSLFQAASVRMSNSKHIPLANHKQNWVMRPCAPRQPSVWVQQSIQHHPPLIALLKLHGSAEG